MTARLHRWDEIALEKVTEMVSRKFVSGERETVAQIYLKRGAVVPQHAHDSEQMTYVLQGALKLLVAGEEVTLRDGELLHIKPGVAHTTHLGGLAAGYLYLKKPRLNIKAEIQYRLVKWRINRMRRKFDVHTGGRTDDVNRRVH